MYLRIIVFCLEYFLKFRQSVMVVIISSAVSHHGVRYSLCLITCYQRDATEGGTGSRQAAPLSYVFMLHT